MTRLARSYSPIKTRIKLTESTLQNKCPIVTPESVQILASHNSTAWFTYLLDKLGQCKGCSVQVRVVKLELHLFNLRLRESTSRTLKYRLLWQISNTTVTHACIGKLQETRRNTDMLQAPNVKPSQCILCCFASVPGLPCSCVHIYFSDLSAQAFNVLIA